MKNIYIATLIKKEKIQENIYICKSIGPIVGFLFGSHFLSSHSKHYIPMFSKFNQMNGNQFYQDIILEEEKFFTSNEEYAYYELKKIENYDNLEVEIQDYKNKYNNVDYFLDFTTKVPVLIRYKRKTIGGE